MLSRFVSAFVALQRLQCQQEDIRLVKLALADNPTTGTIVITLGQRDALASKKATAFPSWPRPVSAWAAVIRRRRSPTTILRTSLGRKVRTAVAIRKVARITTWQPPQRYWRQEHFLRTHNLQHDSPSAFGQSDVARATR